MRRFRTLLDIAKIGCLVAVAAHAAVAAEGPQVVPERYKERPLDVKLNGLEKGATHLSELRGRPVLLKLWATWCEPCRDQDAILDSMTGELAKRNVLIVAVDEGENAAKVRAFLAKTPSPFIVLLDPNQTLARLLKVEAIPFLAALRGDGTVAALYEGLLNREGVLGMVEAASDPSERNRK